MDLRHLTDKQLHLDTINLAQRERSLTTKLLHHLKEIDRRRLFAGHKCPSLHAYCTKILGYSEGSAYRRIQAARMLAELPEIEIKIEEGTLSLMNIAQAASFIGQQSISSIEDKREILNQVENLSKKECEKKLLEISGVEKPRHRVVLYLTEEVFEKLNRVKALIGKKLSNEEVFCKMAEVTSEQLEKKKFKITSLGKSPPPVEVAGRYVPAAIKRAVYKRDKVCTNCGGSFNLNFDHRIPVALGGESSMENVRLLCFSCNQWARRQAGL